MSASSQAVYTHSCLTPDTARPALCPPHPTQQGVAPNEALKTHNPNNDVITVSGHFTNSICPHPLDFHF